MHQGRFGVAITAVLALVLFTWALGFAQNLPAHEVANSLPSTNFSADRTVNSNLPRPAPGFANAHVAPNPQAPNAKPVGEKTCIACHRLEADHFTHTLHALGLHVANRSDPTIPVCEACHGPGSAHAVDPQTKGLIIGYTKSSGTPVATQTVVVAKTPLRFGAELNARMERLCQLLGDEAAEPSRAAIVTTPWRNFRQRD